MASPAELPRVGVVFRPQLPPERMREFVLAAEAAGLDDVWLWEDCFAEGGLASASAALAWTRSVRIGLGLMPVPLRNPAVAAMELAAAAVGRPASPHPVTSSASSTATITPHPAGARDTIRCSRANRTRCR